MDTLQTKQQLKNAEKDQLNTENNWLTEKKDLKCNHWEIVQSEEKIKVTIALSASHVLFPIPTETKGIISARMWFILYQM